MNKNLENFWDEVKRRLKNEGKILLLADKKEITLLGTIAAKYESITVFVNKELKTEWFKNPNPASFVKKFYPFGYIYNEKSRKAFIADMGKEKAEELGLLRKGFRHKWDNFDKMAKHFEKECKSITVF